MKTVQETYDGMDQAEKVFQQTILDSHTEIIRMLGTRFGLSATAVATVLGKVYLEAGATCLYAGLGGKLSRDAKKVAAGTLTAARNECHKYIKPEDIL